MELSEIYAALREHVGDDKSKAQAVAESLLTNVQIVGQQLVDKGAGRKAGEITTRVKAIEAERDNAVRERDELRAEFDEFRIKTPDVKAVEERLNTSWQRKLDAEKTRADSATNDLRSERRKLAIGEFTAALTSKYNDGTQVDPEWVRDVAESRWGNRIVVREDGSIGVLQLNGSTEYEPGEGQSAVSLLAADARKTVPSRYVLANADTGGGIQNGGFGGGGSANPAKVEQQRVEQARAAVSGAF